jgi:hypothetical protein
MIKNKQNKPDKFEENSLFLLQPQTIQQWLQECDDYTTRKTN